MDGAGGVIGAGAGRHVGLAVLAVVVVAQPVDAASLVGGSAQHVVEHATHGPIGAKLGVGGLGGGGFALAIAVGVSAVGELNWDSSMTVSPQAGSPVDVTLEFLLDDGVNAGRSDGEAAWTAKIAPDIAEGRNAAVAKGLKTDYVGTAKDVFLQILSDHGLRAHLNPGRRVVWISSNLNAGPTPAPTIAPVPSDGIDDSRSDFPTVVSLRVRPETS